MSLKVYQSLKAVYLLGYVALNGRNVSVKFTGGQKYPKRINGTLHTNDPAMQKALENSPEYGRNWIRIVPPADVVEKPEPPAQRVEPLPPLTIKAELQEREDLDLKAVVDEAAAESVEKTVVPGIDNAQKAKNYLLQQGFEGVTYKSIMTKKQIYQAAQKFNVSFPDWHYAGD